MAAFLRQQGVDAVCAYPEERRRQRSGPVAAVSLRACQGGPGGFRDYLGERYDESTGQWQELYGRRVTLTFGLDLYGESAGELQTAYDRMAEPFQWEGPAGLALRELSCGETEFDRAGRPLPQGGDGGVSGIPVRRSRRGRHFPGLCCERRGTSMSVTNHERPGVYSRYDASTVVKGRGGGGCVGLAALCGTGTAGTLYTFNRYEEAVTAFGGEETLTELVRLLFLNGAAQVKAVPVAEEAGYKAAFSVLEAAEDIAVVVCDSGELTVSRPAGQREGRL